MSADPAKPDIAAMLALWERDARRVLLLKRALVELLAAHDAPLPDYRARMSAARERAEAILLNSGQ